MPYINRCFALLIIALGTLQSAAQYPVQVQPQIISPPSLSLSSYYTGTIPKLIVTLTNRDLQQPFLQVKLRVKISSNSVQLTSRTNVAYIPINLSPGIPQRLLLSDLEQYLNPNNLNFQGITKQQYLSTGQLPEGLYNFCFEVLDASTNRVLSSPNQCAMSWISLMDPPLLNTPSNNSIQFVRNPSFINFNWTPRHLNSPNSATNTEYEFTLVELLDTRIDQNAAFASSRVLYQVTTRSTTIVYGPAQPQLIPGRKYGWRVRLLPIDLAQDFDKFNNNGYSDVYSFRYKTDCKEPVITQSSISGTTASISWETIRDISTYQVKYRPANNRNSIPKFITVNGHTTQITGLDAGIRYQFWVSYECSDRSESVSEYAFLNASGTALPKGKVPIADILDSKMATFTGSVKWQYEGKRSDEQISLYADKKTPTRTEGIARSGESDPSFDFEGASVKLYLIAGGRKKFLESVKTNSEGKYDLKSPVQDGVYELLFSHSSGMFESKSFSVVPKSTEATGMKKATQDVILKAKSFEFKPLIYSSEKDFGVSEYENFSVDVLIENNDWDKTYGKIAGQLGVSGNQSVTHNRKNYNIIASLSNLSNPAVLLQNLNNSDEYLVRINYPDLKSKIYPLDKIESSLLLTKSFNYNASFDISGVVSHAGAPLEQIRVSVVLNANDILSDLSKLPVSGTTVTLNQMTGADGSFYMKIPRLKKGSKVVLKAINFGLSANPYLGEITIDDKSSYTYDFDLKAQTHTYVGRITGEKGEPIANAQITLDGARSPVRSTDNGFFIIQGDNKTTSNISFSADGYVPQRVAMNSLKLTELDGANANAVDIWETNINQVSSVLEYKNNGGLVNAGLFVVGKNSESLTSIYSLLKTVASEEIVGILDASVVIKRVEYPVEVAVKLNGKFVKADVKIAENGQLIQSLSTKSASSSTIYTVAGRYQIEVQPSDGGPSFVAAKNNFEVIEDARLKQKITVVVQDAVLANIVVKSESSGQPIEGAKVIVEGFKLQAETDSKGKAQIKVPLGKANSFKFIVEKTNHNSSIRMLKDSELKAGEITFSMTSMLDLPVKTISGFEVTVTSQRIDPNRPGEVLISGRLVLPENDVFNPSPSFDKLEFKNVYVRPINMKGDAVAVSDIGFETATLRVIAFGGVPIELDQVHLAKLDGKNDYASATIRGTKAKTVFGAASGAPRAIRTLLNGFEYDAFLLETTPYEPAFTSDKAFAPFEIEDPQGVDLNTMIRAFVSPGVSIDQLQGDKSFGFYFDVPSGYTSDYIDINLFAQLNLSIQRWETELNTDGIQMNGHLKVPEAISRLADNDGLMTMDVFNISAKLNSVDIGFDISETQPFFMQLQKVQAKVTSLTVLGIGSVNCGVSLGGEVWLTKRDRNGTVTQRDDNGVLTINKLSFINAKDAITLSGEFSLPESGIGVKGLTFKTDNGKTISFSFNFNEKTFEFEAGGMLTYESTAGSSPNPVASKLFPLEIQTFKLKTATWSMLLVARPNKQIDFGVIKVNISAFLVNIGYNASLDQMAAMLENPSLTDIPVLGGADDLVDESRAAWAIGVQGSIEFPIKDLQVEVGATVLLGNINNKLQFQINEILLKVIRDPVFTMEVQVAMRFDDDKTGFEAMGKMVVLGNGLGASLKFYKYKSGGIELGASLTVSTRTGIITGPVTWLSIGGGFSLNTATNIYEVWLNGEVTNTGSKREVMFVKIAKLGVLFATNTCGPKPVIEGNGELYLKNEQWLQVKMKADFCKRTFLLDLKGFIPTVPGLAKIDAQGTVYAAADYGNEKACIFLYVNGSMNFTFVNSRIAYALGVNVYKNSSRTPVEVKNAWSNIGTSALEQNGNYFNAFYVGAFLNVPDKRGDFGVSVGRFRALRLQYNVYGTASAEFYSKFSSTQLGFLLKVNAGANGKVTILGSSLNGKATLNANLNGGYDREWYLNGKINANLTVWAGRANCNSVSIRWGGCFNSPYPCGVNMCSKSVRYPCGVRTCKKWGVRYPCGVKMCSKSVRFPCGVRFCTKRVCPVPVGIGGAKICVNVKGGFNYRQSESTRVYLER